MNAIVALDFNTCGLNTDVSSNPEMKTCRDKNAQQDTDYTAQLLDVVHNNSSGVVCFSSRWSEMASNHEQVYVWIETCIHQCD